ncbi:MAG: DAK2 domain-containing protein [Austwickia sp.]|nr:DAK2 domain-containing protein [Austwickia sp.]
MSAVAREGDRTTPLMALDGGDLRRWAFRADTALRVHRHQIDALNVFPVPDGDTGTNMFLTLHSALEALVGSYLTQSPQVSVVAGMQALTQHMLFSARGNSGVILSQLLRGMADVVAAEELGPHPLVVDAAVVTRMMRGAAGTARRAVGDPVDGTILTVADAAAAAAETALAGGGSLAEVTGAAWEAANTALAHTPRQLPLLARAGVVDAGGAGLVVLLAALDDVVRAARPGRARSAEADSWWTGGDPRPIGGSAQAPAAGGYEVMYLLESCSDDDAERLARRLRRLGDSVLVVGDRRLRTVHVHLEDAGAAVEAGLDMGRLSGVRVAWLGGATTLPSAPGPHGCLDAPDADITAAPDAARVGAVAGASGPGLAATFRAAGANTVDSRPGQRATTGQILQAITETGSSQVIVLPNDGDTLMAARAAATLAGHEGRTVHLVPTTSPIQGMVALAVLDPAQDLGANATRMTEAAAVVRCGRVAPATRAASTQAGTCRPGDVLGFIGDTVVAIAADTTAVALMLLEQLGVDRAELVTLVAGAQDPEVGERVAEVIAQRWPAVEVTCLRGGQPVDGLLFGVE